MSNRQTIDSEFKQNIPVDVLDKIRGEEIREEKNREEENKALKFQIGNLKEKLERKGKNYVSPEHDRKQKKINALKRAGILEDICP